MTTKKQAWEAELASVPTLNEMMNKLAIKGYKGPKKGDKEAKKGDKEAKKANFV